MARYIAKRLLLAIVTLWLLATMVFLIVNILPGDVGRKILGPFAPQESVDAFNKRLGTDKPLIVQYGRSMRNIVTFDFGESYQSGVAVSKLARTALWRSAKLAGIALLMTVPISVAAGVYAARVRDTLRDRAIVVFGLASSSIPEFVTGSFLIILFGVNLKWFPVLASTPDGAAVVTQLKALFLPALSLAIVYFGYIARMARAGTIVSLDAEYTRTAIMKGLPGRTVIGRHVLRNALVPTVSVIGVQIGYLFGGLIGVEKIFNYNGLGQMLLLSARAKDIPVLQTGVLAIGAVYMLSTLLADLVIAWLNPRSRAEMRG